MRETMRPATESLESMAKPGNIDPEALAIDALAFLAEDAERLGRFLTVTGLQPATLRIAARDPMFLVAVLDHCLADEALLLAFAENRRVLPDMIATARARLAGGR